MSFRLKTIVGVALIEGILLLILVLSSVNYLTQSSEEELALRLLPRDIARLDTVDQPVAINFLKRFAADRYYQKVRDSWRDHTQQVVHGNGRGFPRQALHILGLEHQLLPAELDQAEDHGLTERREEGSGVHNDETRNARGAGGREQGVH